MVHLAAHHSGHSLLPALRSLASNAPTSFSPADLQTWFTATTTDPLQPAVLFATVLSLVVFVLGEVTGNVSQVDRLWTFLPVLYSAHFTLYPYFTGIVDSIYDLDRRMLLVLALQCCWSARLTYQSARRGFLDPRTEDYRWPLVRARLNPLVFKLFNLVFISFIQNYLLLAAELPQYLLLTHTLSSSSHVSALARAQPHQLAGAKPVPLNVADAALAVLFLATLVIEMRADNQQQRFQKLKHAAVEKQKKGVALTVQEQKAIERGFVAEGLWSWSRHPNFAAEQTTWYLLYAFTVLPFLPASQSITSHPLSTVSSLLSTAAHPALPTLLGKLKLQAVQYSNALPSVDGILTALEHPVAFLRLHLSAPSELLGKARAAYPAFAALVYSEAKRGLEEAKRDEGVYWNYAVVSPVAMSVLFKASTVLTEGISAGKYPLYKSYQRRVAQFWPVLTPFKGLWLFLTARKGRTERKIWGGITDQRTRGGKGGKAL
ncbi:hypothetical protein JCM8097_002963 [Rhodosporidiobolus ruineniae]